MKILHITAVFPPYHGGLSHVPFEETKRLAELGHEVHVVTLANRNEGSTTRVEKGVHVHRFVAAIPYGKAGWLPQLGGFFKQHEFDAVHVHVPFFGVVEWIAVLLKLGWKPRRFVLTFHMDIVANGFVRMVSTISYRFFLPTLLKAADVIHVASKQYASNSTLKRHWEVVEDKLLVVPFGVDVERFSPASASSDKHKANAILFLGGLDRNHYFKGVDVLLDALARLKGRQDWHMFIGGEGDLRPQYERQSRALGLEKRVSFLGRVPDAQLAEYYRCGDFFVMPSIDKSEAFGTVALEAQASGLPVIASDLDGVRDAVSDDKTGLLVAPKSVRDLRDKIVWMLDHPIERRKMGHTARARMEHSFSWEAHVKKLEKAYEGRSQNQEVRSEERNRILVVSNLYPPKRRGGAEKVAKVITDAMHSEEIKVSVLSTTDERVDGVKKMIEDNVEVYRYRPRLPYHLLEDNDQPIWKRILWHKMDLMGWWSRRVAEDAINETNPDVILTHNLRGMGMSLVRAIRSSKARWVHVLHDVQLLIPSGQCWYDRPHFWQNSAVTRPYQWFLKRLMGSPDLVIAPSNYVIDAHKEQGFFKDSQTAILVNPLLTDVSGKRKVAKLNDRSLNMLYVGQMSDTKGVPTLLEALQHIEGEAVVTMIGDGAQFDDFAAQSLLLPNNIEINFKGQVPHTVVMEAMRTTDVVIFPSVVDENCPGVILEALAYGVPILSSDVGSMREFVHESGLFEPGNARALVQKIHELREGKVVANQINPLSPKEYVERLGAHLRLMQ